jgi:hypothetical protein
VLEVNWANFSTVHAAIRNSICQTRAPGFGSSQTRKPGLGKNPPGLDSLVHMQYINNIIWRSWYEVDRKKLLRHRSDEKQRSAVHRLKECSEKDTSSINSDKVCRQEWSSLRNRGGTTHCQLFVALARILLPSLWLWCTGWLRAKSYYFLTSLSPK